jgi:hypothetical protein
MVTLQTDKKKRADGTRNKPYWYDYGRKRKKIYEHCPQNKNKNAKIPVLCL